MVALLRGVIFSCNRLLRSIMRFPLIIPWIFVYHSILRLPYNAEIILLVPEFLITHHIFDVTRRFVYKYTRSASLRLKKNLKLQTVPPQIC